MYILTYYKWIETEAGQVLTKFVEEYESFISAGEHATEHVEGYYKIYDSNQNLVHSGMTDKPSDLYAG